MSTKYPGGIITKNYVAPTTTSASGIWTLEQQEQAQKAGIWPFGGPFNYIEDVFNTYLTTGAGANATIVNDINLSTYGGLVWQKTRGVTGSNTLVDTVRGVNKILFSNTSGAENTSLTNFLTAFNTNGFTIGTDNNLAQSTKTGVSWTWRKQPKFFDIVTFTTTGSNPNTGNISHNLGSTPGCVMVKSTSGAQDWKVYHIGTEGGGLLAKNRYLQLNDTSSAISSTNWINVSSTTISFPGGALDSGVDFVAYLFAHNAGGFGLTGTDNVISCGSFTSDGSGLVSLQNLGYEPQWLMFKQFSGSFTSEWSIIDTIRGWSNTGDARLAANYTAAEVDDSASPNYCVPSATGFSFPTAGLLNNSSTYIYIAIRRGPMKVPTTGTSVYNGITRTGTGANTTVTGVGFSPDLYFASDRSPGGQNSPVVDRLRGNTKWFRRQTTDAESTTSIGVTSFNMDGVSLGTSGTFNASAELFVDWNLKRAPSFFDVVCYAGSGSVTTQTHNLGVVPEMMIHKARYGTTNASWAVYVSSLGAGNTLTLNNTNGVSASPNNWNSTAPTSSVFTVGTSTSGETNYSGTYYVAYLFATCAGVSKVGSYTGNGTTQTINCGFTGGARFVLIKRTDSTGDWYVYDTARGMTTLTDPYLLMNDTAAESATLGSVTTVSTGFALNSTILAAINVSSATYIFLAIA